MSRNIPLEFTTTSSSSDFAHSPPNTGQIPVKNGLNTGWPEQPNLFACSILFAASPGFAPDITPDFMWFSMRASASEQCVSQSGFSTV
jgi:hypothetical protein